MIGRPIHDQWFELSSAGRNQMWCSLDCSDCDTRINVTLEVLVRAENGRAWLTCKDCKRTRKAINAARQTAKKRAELIASGQTPRPYKTRGLKPVGKSPFGLNGLRALAKLKFRPKRKERALQILARTCRAQIKAGIDPRPLLDQMLIESIEIAQLEERGVQLPGEWTAQNRSEGLKIRSYCLADHAPPI